MRGLSKRKTKWAIEFPYRTICFRVCFIEMVQNRQRTRFIGQPGYTGPIIINLSFGLDAVRTFLLHICYTIPFYFQCIHEEIEYITTYRAYYEKFSSRTTTDHFVWQMLKCVNIFGFHIKP